ncbi:ervatamin-C-like [Pomacea canaliculata]|nr:ervatamin-C-like [Pomacea canaliculata]
MQATLSHVLGLLLCVTLSSQASQLRPWAEWKAEYSKVYDSQEADVNAFAAWLRNTEYVTAHNNQPHHTFKLKVNKFGDKIFNITPGVHTLSNVLRFMPRLPHPIVTPKPPASWDWRTKGVISPVQNQGQMGSAEAIVIAADLDSALAITSGSLKNLSAQEVVDCCSVTPGLLDSNVYKCIFKLGGLCTAADYPQRSSGSCHSPKYFYYNGVRAQKNETAMVLAVLKTPLVVYVDASLASFQMYHSGVYSDPSCGATIDHTMQLVGYGTSQGQPYWILKNSWGVDWGMSGYMLMVRGRNMCGVATMAKYPSGASPPEIHPH